MRQKTDFPFEVIIVDNSVNPNNAENHKNIKKKYPDIKLIINDKNIGYTKGNNLGVKESSGEYLFIVNPDVIWNKPDTMQTMVDYMDKHKKIGILAPKQINENDGSVAMTVRSFPKLSLQIARRTQLRNLPIIRDWVAHDEMRDMNVKLTQQADWIQSSFWITRRSLWERFGGLDEDYLIFMSDPDFCRKCWQFGFEVVYFPETEVLADGVRCSHGSIKEFFNKWVLRQHFKDALIYGKKYAFRKNPRRSSYHP